MLVMLILWSAATVAAFAALPHGRATARSFGSGYGPLRVSLAAPPVDLAGNRGGRLVGHESLDECPGDRYAGRAYPL